jgi:hypothetical protein
MVLALCPSALNGFPIVIVHTSSLFHLLGLGEMNIGSITELLPLARRKGLLLIWLFLPMPPSGKIPIVRF